MLLRSSLSFTVVISLLSGCGFAAQRASVSRSFQARFGCASASMSQVDDGYHVEGCGRSAEYVCFDEPDPFPRQSHQRGTGMLVSALVGAALGGSGERCVLASSERSSSPVLASEAPVGVGRAQAKDGRTVLKTRVLFAGGHLRALAAPRDHPEQVLLIVRSVARMEDAPCASELYHDGVRVPILQEAREGRYEARLVVPIGAVVGADKAVRFAGTVCGVEFDLDPSSRATLGLFAARFREERARLEESNAAVATSPEAPLPSEALPSEAAKESDGATPAVGNAAEAEAAQ